MSIKYPKRLSQTGDTIVEVMVVLAILGLAISIAYATANRSLLNARQAQENSAATELVQNQVEDLRVLAPNSTADNTDPTSNIYLPTAAYCVQDPTIPHPIITTLSTCVFGNANLYQIVIYNCDKISAAPCNGLGGTDTFVVQALWPDVLGQGNDTVTTVYRVHAL